MNDPIMTGRIAFTQIALLIGWSAMCVWVCFAIAAPRHAPVACASSSTERTSP